MCVCTVAAIRLTIVNGVAAGEAQPSAKVTPTRMETNMVPESQPSDADLENEGDGAADRLLPLDATSSEDDDSDAYVLKLNEDGGYTRTRRGPGRSPSPPKPTPRVNTSRVCSCGV